MRMNGRAFYFYGFKEKRGAPTPQNVEQNILEYTDRKNKEIFFTTNFL